MHTSDRTLRMAWLSLWLLLVPPAVAQGRTGGSPSGDPASPARSRTGDPAPVNDRGRLPDPVCGPGAPEFVWLVRAASEALDLVKRDNAMEMLSRADRRMTCEPRVIPRAELARYFFLWGVLRVYQGAEDDDDHFTEALAIAPDMPPPVEYNAQIQRLFTAARERMSSHPRVRVRYQRPMPDKLELTVDGEPVQGESGELLAGMHLLQIVNPDGEVLVAGRQPLSTSMPQPVRLPPAGLIPGKGGSGGKEGKSATSSPTGLQTVSRVGKVLTLGLGAGTVLAAGWTGLSVYRGNQAITYDDFKIWYGRADIGNAAVIIGLAGTTVSALVWQVPRWVERGRAKRVNQAAFRMEVGPGTFGLRMEGTW